MGDESPELNQERKWNQEFYGCREPDPVAHLGPIRSQGQRDEPRDAGK